MSSLNTSVKEERMSNVENEVYFTHTIKIEPMSLECEDQCSYSLIKVEKDSEDDTDAPSTHDIYIKQEELEERTTAQQSSKVKDEIDISPTVIQPQYIGSSLHTTDASKAELIQCGGADAALGRTTPGAALYRGNSKRSRSVVLAGTSGKIKKKDKGILKGNNLSALVEEKPFTCNICEFKCKVKSNLVKHRRMHTGDKPISCNICEYKCNQLSNLEVHMRTHTGDKPFSCNICDYKCKRKSHLEMHTARIHTGEKPFSCSDCKYKCADKSSLVKHMRTHTGEQPFSCNICQYKFNLKSNLMRHMRLHNVEKPFSCYICEYKCKRKSHLAIHVRTHTGEKPYSCSNCKYKCVDKSYLVKHNMRIHTEEMPFSCNICEYKCKLKSSLATHLVRMHRREISL